MIEILTELVLISVLRTFAGHGSCNPVCHDVTIYVHL